MRRRHRPIVAACVLALVLSGCSSWQVTAGGAAATLVGIDMASKGDNAYGTAIMLGGAAVTGFGLYMILVVDRYAQHDGPPPRQIIISPNGAALSYRF